MSAESPDVQGSILLPLVDALTAGGEAAPALLVQVERDWAAVAVKPSGVLVVLLDARQREPWGVVAARAAAVLRTESPEVLDGLFPGIMAVVLVGSAATEDGLTTASPAVIEALARQVHWIAIGPRGVVSDSREGLSPDATKAFKALDGLVRAAAAKAAGLEVAPASARARTEHAGEAALAAEARFRDKTRTAWPPATTGLLLACGAMMLLQLAFKAMWAPGLIAMGALAGSLVREGRVEALLASTLLHGGLLHLAMNGLALRSLGGLLENLIGWRRLLSVFTISAVGGTLACAIVKPDQLVVGASGGIFGLMAALLALTLRRGGEVPELARVRLKQALGSALFFNMAISLLPGISLLGHAGGGVTGFALGISGAISAGVEVPWMPPPDPARAERANGIFRALAIACVAALALSVGAAFARGRPWDLDPAAATTVRAPGTIWVVVVPSNARVSRGEGAPARVQAEPLAVRVVTTPAPTGELPDPARLFDGARALPYELKKTERATSLDGLPAIVLLATTSTGARYARWVLVDQGVAVDVEAVLAAGAPPAWAAAFDEARPQRRR